MHTHSTNTGFVIELNINTADKRKHQQVERHWPQALIAPLSRHHGVTVLRVKRKHDEYFKWHANQIHIDVVLSTEFINYSSTERKHHRNASFTYHHTTTISYFDYIANNKHTMPTSPQFTSTYRLCTSDTTTNTRHKHKFRREIKATLQHTYDVRHITSVSRQTDVSATTATHPHLHPKPKFCEAIKHWN